MISLLQEAKFEQLKRTLETDRQNVAEQLEKVRENDCNY